MIDLPLIKLQMTFEDDSFNAVIDKGILDNLMRCHQDDSSSGDTQEQAPTATTSALMFGHIRRILKFGGRYICISLAQERETKALVDYFSNE